MQKLAFFWGKKDMICYRMAAKSAESHRGGILGIPIRGFDRCHKPSMIRNPSMVPLNNCSAVPFIVLIRSIDFCS